MPTHHTNGPRHHTSIDLIMRTVMVLQRTAVISPHREPFKGSLDEAQPRLSIKVLTLVLSKRQRRIKIYCLASKKQGEKESLHRLTRSLSICSMLCTPTKYGHTIKNTGTITASQT